MLTFREFKSAQAARDYRHEHGTGGWIFEDERTGKAVLFPPEMTPTSIFRHPLATGKTGNLIGHG